jgi:hypothetical protein
MKGKGQLTFVAETALRFLGRPVAQQICVSSAGNLTRPVFCPWKMGSGYISADALYATTPA